MGAKKLEHSYDCNVKRYPNQMKQCNCGFFKKPHYSYMSLNRTQIARKTVQEVREEQPEMSLSGTLIEALTRLTGMQQPEESVAAIDDVITQALQTGQEAGVKIGAARERERIRPPHEIYDELKMSLRGEFEARRKKVQGALIELENFLEIVNGSSSILNNPDTAVHELLCRVGHARAKIDTHMPWGKLDEVS
jgi:hypothetical protein